jgi:hypothetical protein
MSVDGMDDANFLIDQQSSATGRTITIFPRRSSSGITFIALSRFSRSVRPIDHVAFTADSSFDIQHLIAAKSSFSVR